MPAATTTILVSGFGSCTSSSWFHMFWIIARYGRDFPPCYVPWADLQRHDGVRLAFEGAVRECADLQKMSLTSNMLSTWLCYDQTNCLSFSLSPRRFPASLPRTGNQCGCRSADMRAQPDHLPASFATGEHKSSDIPTRRRTPVPTPRAATAHA